MFMVDIVNPISKKTTDPCVSDQISRHALDQGTAHKAVSTFAVEIENSRKWGEWEDWPLPRSV
jgi:hypothetical protein